MREAVRTTVLRVATRVVRSMLALPDPLLRRIAGRPVTVEGDELTPTAQLLVKLEALSPRTEPQQVTLQRARREFDLVAAGMLSGAARGVATRDLMIPGAERLLRARVYLPPATTAQPATMVYFHGGGFVLGSIRSHDGVCRFLAKHSGVRIVSVEYRLAPEHPYPAAVNDAIAAFRYVCAHAARFGATPGAIGVGGDSAGAALAAVTAQVCVEEGSVVPAFNLMIYPVTDGVGGHRSRKLFRRGFFPDGETIDWYQSHYVPDPALLTHPRMSPLHAKDFTGLPPTCVVTGGFDPFRDEGADYADRLRAHGVPVIRLHYPGMVHGFTGFLATDAHARRATYGIAGALRRLANVNEEPFRLRLGT